MCFPILEAGGHNRPLSPRNLGKTGAGRNMESF
jgi:hypothetical protein